MGGILLGRLRHCFAFSRGCRQRTRIREMLCRCVCSVMSAWMRGDACCMVRVLWAPSSRPRSRSPRLGLPPVLFHLFTQRLATQTRRQSKQASMVVCYTQKEEKGSGSTVSDAAKHLARGCNVAVLIHSRATCISARSTYSFSSKPPVYRSKDTQHKDAKALSRSVERAIRMRTQTTSRSSSKASVIVGLLRLALEPCHLSVCTPMPLPPALPSRTQ